MTVKELLKQNRDNIHDIASTHGIIRINVFGSSVNNEENVSGDIDLLVEFEEGRSLFDLIRFKEEMELLLGRPVDVVTKDALHGAIRERVLVEAVPL